jgi:trk system potassium uptake protein TrkH
LVILALIQLGGLGIMTAAVALVLILGRSVDLRQQTVLREALDHDTLSGARRLTLFILGMTAAFECAGAAALGWQWRGRFDCPLQTLYHAAFHSVSAFCNAGFSTFSDNLMSFRDDLTTNLTIGLLIVGGGLGFTVIQDFTAGLRGRGGRPHRPLRLRVQTRIVITVTLLLIAGGAALIYLIERTASLRELPLRSRILVAAFQSVTARTAGFNTCDIGRLAAPTLLALIGLMFIGASPGGTGGGIKTTTVAVLWAVVLSRLRGRANVELWRRTIPSETLLKAVSVLCVSLLLVFAFAGVLMYTERAAPLVVAFEIVSAFGTVGLSAGLTPALTPAGKLIVTLMMLIGRLGPLTMAYAFVLRGKPARHEFAEERVMIG